MGKNTLMKRCIRLYCESEGDEKWTPLLEELVGNVGIIFTKVSGAASCSSLCWGRTTISTCSPHESTSCCLCMLALLIPLTGSAHFGSRHSEELPESGCLIRSVFFRLLAEALGYSLQPHPKLLPCGHCLQGDLNEVREQIMSFKVGAPARVGLVAPNSVEVPAGGTGLDPSQTNFFQVCSSAPVQPEGGCVSWKTCAAVAVCLQCWALWAAQWVAVLCTPVWPGLSTSCTPEGSDPSSELLCVACRL